MSPLSPPGLVLAELLEGCEAGPAETVPLAQALGRVLAADLVAAVEVPPFANSAMDGYAVRSADVADPGAELLVVDASMAGHPATAAVRPGEAVKIMTGGVMPEGADAVCIKELVQPGRDERHVRLEVALRPGEHVRGAGDDVRSGDLVVRAGTVLSAAQVGAAAGVGATSLDVVVRPRVGVLSTGDELVESGPLGPGMLYDSNRPALLAAVAEAGCAPVDLGRARDEPVSLAATLLAAGAACDVVLMSGGVSVGDADFGHRVLAELCGDSFRWLQLAMKPGKPFACGRIDATGTLVVGLPGNPVSALVSFEMLVRPILLATCGRTQLHRPRLLATAGAPFDRQPDGKVHLVRVSLHLDEHGTLLAVPVEGQASHQLRALAGADGLAILPDGDGVPRGGPVTTIVLRPDAPQGEFSARSLERPERSAVAR